MQKQVKWSALKSKRLKQVRGVSFEEILKGKLIRVGENPNRPNQNIYFIYYKRYIWAVPFVDSETEIFLKTLYPSRKHTKIYKRKGEL